MKLDVRFRRWLRMVLIFLPSASYVMVGNLLPIDSRVFLRPCFRRCSIRFFIGYLHFLVFLGYSALSKCIPGSKDTPTTVGILSFQFALDPLNILGCVCSTSISWFHGTLTRIMPNYKLLSQLAGWLSTADQTTKISNTFVSNGAWLLCFLRLP